MGTDGGSQRPVFAEIAHKTAAKKDQQLRVYYSSSSKVYSSSFGRRLKWFSPEDQGLWGRMSQAVALNLWINIRLVITYGRFKNKYYEYRCLLRIILLNKATGRMESLWAWPLTICQSHNNATHNAAKCKFDCEYWVGRCMQYCFIFSMCGCSRPISNIAVKLWRPCWKYLDNLHRNNSIAK